MKIVIGNYPKPTDSRNLILNDEVMNGNDTFMFAIVSKIEGIETAPYRNGTGDWSGADGGYISSQLFSARTITISGTYIDRRAGCDYTDQAVDQFDHLARLYIRSRLPIRKKQYVRLFMDSGMTFYTEGYCTDIKMDYTFIGHGDYQITIYCPDPALYRGDADGTLGSEWNSATLRKENSTGFVSSGVESDGDVYYANMYQENGENHGIVWGTGGRSTPVSYAGDYPYYPQLIVEPGAGEHITNPRFLSVTENKFFGLGYPETDVAKFEVTAVDADGAVTSVNCIDTGSYDSDFSANNISLTAQSYAPLLGRTEYGTGASLNLTMTAADERWNVSTYTVANGGVDYVVGDILTPSIAGASILTIGPNQQCIIDMAEHTATLGLVGSSNVESVAYYITPGSEWFTLPALATSNIIFASADESDAQSARIRWRNGYMGI